MLHSLSLRYTHTRALDIVMLAIIDTNLARSVLLLLIKQRLVPGLCANKKFVHGPLHGNGPMLSGRLSASSAAS